MSGPSIEGSRAAPALQAAFQRRWVLWRAQKMAFWVMYDYAAPLILLNVMMLAAVVAPAWLLARALPTWGWPPFALALALLPGLLAGQAGLFAALIAEESFSFRLFWRGVRAFAAGMYVLAALYGAAACVAGLGVWFYLGQFAPVWPLAGHALAGVSAGSGGLLAMTSMFSLPALIHQRGAPVSALRVSFALVARYPGVAIGLLLMAGAWLLLALTPPGLLLLSTLPLVALGSCAYELLARAQALEAALERDELPPPGTLDGDDIFLNRGFTDLLFPWKL